MKGISAKSGHSLAYRVLCLLAACALAVACVPAAAFSELGDAAWAATATGNRVGATFTVNYGEDGSEGSVTFEVTAVAVGHDEGAQASESQLGEVTVTDGTGFTGASLELDGVAQTVGGVQYTYAVTAVDSYAFVNNRNLQSVSFSHDLTGTADSGYGKAVGSYAFARCYSLMSVSFPEYMNGIGDYAFQYCTSLVNVEFPENAVMYNNGYLGSAPIGNYVFYGCESLVSISIPALVDVSRKGDFYYTPEDYGCTFTTDAWFPSGYIPFWHNNTGPINTMAGFGVGVFEGCSALETIEFQAGSPIGMFAYWDNSGIFDGLSSLKAVVYNGDQAYWGNPNQARQNKTYYDVWEDCPDVELYYSVDYYATADYDEAMADDAFASEADYHVNFKRSTPVDSICAGSVEEEWVYAGQDGSIGADSVPDPNEAAEAAGLVVDEEHQWVWKLTESQQRRTGLDDSCRAYLVSADDLSAGRIANSQTQLTYDSCDANLSRCLVDGVSQDTLFDPSRFADKYQSAPSVNAYYTSNNTSDYYTVGKSSGQIYTIGSDGITGFLEGLEVCAADGTLVDINDCVVTFQSYDAESGTLTEASDTWDENGAYLMTVTPLEGSGLSGSLQEWVVLEGNSGIVRSYYTDNTSSMKTTAYVAAAYDVFEQNPYGEIYSVTVGAGDATSALLAASYAGLADARIYVDDVAAASEDYGFKLTRLSDGESYSYAPSDSMTASTFAVQVYKQFTYGLSGNASGSETLGATECNWGNTALVVDATHVNDAAAAAAALAYGLQAPVFYLDDNGEVGEGTLACLEDFDRVIAVGDEAAFSAEAYSSLESSLGSQAEVVRLAGEDGSASALSLAAADLLMGETDDAGEPLASMEEVSVCDATDPVDAIGALNRTGHCGGVTLVSASSADTKRILQRLHDARDTLDTVFLFGRDSSLMFPEDSGLEETVKCVWNEDGSGYDAPEIGAGDTVELYGALLAIEEDGSLTWQEDLWAHDVLEAGDYAYAGGTYTLAQAVDAYEWGDDASGISGDGSATLGADETLTVYLEYAGTGTLSAASSDESVVKASVQAGSEEGQWVLTLQGVAKGSATVTVSDGADATLEIAVSVTAATSSLTLGDGEDVEYTSPWLSSTTDATTTTTTTTTSSTITDSSSSTTSTASNTSGSSGITISSATVSGSSSSGTSSTSASSGTSSSGTSSGTTLTLDLGEAEDADSDWLGTADESEAVDISEDVDDGDADADESLVWDDGRTDEGTQEETSSGGVSPALVGGGVALAVAAVGCALWYVLRRRSSSEIDMEFAE